MHMAEKAFDALPFPTRVAAAARADAIARRAGALAVAVAVLLEIWRVAPSFDIVPAVIGAALRLIALLGYGLVPPADSFVAAASARINLGYAHVLGPLVITLLAGRWFVARRRAAGLIEAIHAQRPAPTVATRWRWLPLWLRWALIGWLVLFIAAAQISLGALRMHADGETARSAQSGGIPDQALAAACRRTEVRRDTLPDAQGRTGNAAAPILVAPWPGSDRWWTWLPGLRPATDQWCVGATQGEFVSFKGAIRHSYFEQKAQGRAAHVLSLPAIGVEAVTASGGEGSAAVTPLGQTNALSLSFRIPADTQPFREFPHVFPDFVVLGLLAPLVILGMGVLDARRWRGVPRVGWLRAVERGA